VGRRRRHERIVVRVSLLRLASFTAVQHQRELAHFPTGSRLGSRRAPSLTLGAG
jgi:hypothetical protein